ncbi:hypothetical protein NM208_g6295 [Fusarium decemcellulare]|uniref:Uncharacterized protein n=1 Tax=Fusarium decemcellulare TaxID=57161 RepID=A0ACC1SDW3_9HYPO|nr:hypothetical protein NM208_g6295 [Fusarium decemcellulare]
MKFSLLFSVASVILSAVAQDPLITKRWTADPSAHVFNGKLFLYVSHDIDAGIPPNSEGDHFAMKDYYFYSMEDVYGSKPVEDHGLALALEDIPWASRQLWAPDAAYKHGKYYLYFPARDKEDIFRIGVAVSSKPGGPFKADKSFIPGTFSIDPASFTDSDGKTYLSWGGLHGGQLQCWQNKTTFDDKWSGQKEPPNEDDALSPQIAALSDDMHKLAEAPRDMIIFGRLRLRGSKYYLTYSTGTTHYLVYATADSPYGPYTYQGRLLEPVSGWTTHGSIVEFKGQWWLFYHDSKASNGVDWLRQVKAKKIWYDYEGKIVFEAP